jgi:hypothetical protein
MEHLLKAPPYFQITLAAVMGIGVVALILALAVFKFFLPRLGKALLSPASPEGEQKQAAPVLINPAQFCTACEAEHKRSLRNEANIGKLFDKFDDGFAQISKEIRDMNTDIIKALAAKN